MRLLVIYLALLSSSLFPSQILKKIALSKQWLRLNHYEKTLFGYKSLLDGEKFFFSKNGKNNPQDELLSMIKAFQSESKYKLICQYPSRTKFLIDQGLIDEFKSDCKDLDFWKSSLDPEYVSLVFASSYPGNPASIFGHTFLRLHSKSNQSNKDRELLDYILNFAATTGSDGGISFALFGLFGGYEGHFSMYPYHLKIKEYAHLEHRDLWSYQLNFSKKEIIKLLDHIWELDKNTFFDYYFLDENCSYVIMRLFDIIRPSLNLEKDFPLYTMPVDTVKAVSRAGLIESKKLIPSQYQEIFGQYELLSEDEKESFHQLFDGNQEQKLSRNVIDTSLSYLRYIQAKEKRPYDKNEQTMLRRLLLKRSKLPSAKKNIKYKDNSEPLLAHDSAQFETQIIAGKDDIKTSLNIKLAGHNFLNPSKGYLPLTRLDVLNFQLSYDSLSQKYAFSKFKFVDAISLQPINQIDSRWSWRLSGFFENEEDRFCSSCQEFFFRPGFGTTVELFHNIYLYSLIEMNLVTGVNTYKKIDYSIEPHLGLVWQKDKIGIHADFVWRNRVREDVSRYTRTRFQLLYSFTKTSIGFDYILFDSLERKVQEKNQFILNLAYFY